MIQNDKYKINSKKTNIKYKNKTTKHVRFIGGINDENKSSDQKAIGKLVAKTKKNTKEISNTKILSNFDEKIENLQYLLFQNIIDNVPDITINNIIGSKIPFKYENESDNPVILYFLYAYNLYKTDSEKIPQIKKKQYILKQKINEILIEIDNNNQNILPDLFKKAKKQVIKIILLKQLFFDIISYKKYIMYKIKSKDFQLNDIIKNIDYYTENQKNISKIDNNDYKNTLSPIYMKLYMDIINITISNINEEIKQYIENQIKLEKIDNDDKKNIIDNMQNLIEVIDEIVNEKEGEQNITGVNNINTETSLPWSFF